MKRSEKEHPKARQLYIPVRDLLELPYLRKARAIYTSSSPGRFNPKRPHFGNQALIAATVWRRLPCGPGDYCWVTDIFWLKDYDPPFSYEVYNGDHRPSEAVDPIEVLWALGIVPKGAGVGGASLPPVRNEEGVQAAAPQTGDLDEKIPVEIRNPIRRKFTGADGATYGPFPTPGQQVTLPRSDAKRWQKTGHVRIL